MDTVALEAECKCGSIKKNRHALLIRVIEHATQELGQNVLPLVQQLEQDS